MVETQRSNDGNNFIIIDTPALNQINASNNYTDATANTKGEKNF